ncbi:MAG: [Lachnospiraceae bacterium]|nr:[FeFe] hydrogenase H-cluster maturation GTPase HydF [Lachnospiraceae bacterium]MBR0435044.1 [FeFe] hydrogenase H-cluster maturation GTPase HydF [Lachnospiraceae bacterium]
MGLTDTPRSERIHIGIFGHTNAGKSSLINALTGQKISIVADLPGTTTDPVHKSMEILPLGPVVITDTPGLDDKTVLGKERIVRAFEVLRSTDLALIVVDGTSILGKSELAIIMELNERKVPYVIVVNKIDKMKDIDKRRFDNDPAIKGHVFYVSARNKENINELREYLGTIMKGRIKENHMLDNLVKKDDVIILVTPIDESAPKGRMILPQQQAIRDVLHFDGITMVVQVNELEAALRALKNPPALVVTDSQAFASVDKIVPSNIPLTSFSILLARLNYDILYLSESVKKIKELSVTDTVVISEGCTHHRQCGDIGTVKLPNLIRRFTGIEPRFKFTSGTDFDESIDGAKLIIHCGGCMLNDKEMEHRMELAKAKNIPMTNYGVAIAYMTGILDRALKPLL